MTDDEALALKPGDRVWRELRGGPHKGTSVSIEVRSVRAGTTIHGQPYVAVYGVADGLTAGGNRRTKQLFWPGQLRQTERLEPLTANVYADWLDERGEARAAGLLRKAFPIDPGVKP